MDTEHDDRTEIQEAVRTRAACHRWAELFQRQPSKPFLIGVATRAFAAFARLATGEYIGCYEPDGSLTDEGEAMLEMLHEILAAAVEDCRQGGVADRALTEERLGLLRELIIQGGLVAPGSEVG